MSDGLIVENGVTLGDPTQLTPRVDQEPVVLLFSDRKRQILGDARRFRGNVLTRRRLQRNARPREDDELAFPRRLGGYLQRRKRNVQECGLHEPKRHANSSSVAVAMR